MKLINLVLGMATSVSAGVELPARNLAVGVPMGGAQHPPPGRFCGFFGWVSASGSVFFDWDNWDNWDTRFCCGPQSFRRSLFWCLVPHKAVFCSAKIALPHRRPHAARHSLTRPMLASAGLVLQDMGRAVIGQVQRLQA